MAAAQQGDGVAYRRLLDELKTWLARFYAQRLPDAHVDDAVQDPLIAIHEKRHTYDPARPFKPWLAAIARYKWIDRLRSIKRHGFEELPAEAAQDDHGNAVLGAVVLRQLLALLKPAQREVIELVKLKGFSIQEASSRSGQSVPLVKVNIHRGMARLMAAIREQSDAG